MLVGGLASLSIYTLWSLDVQIKKMLLVDGLKFGSVTSQTF